MSFSSPSVSLLCTKWRQNEKRQIRKERSKTSKGVLTIGDINNEIKLFTSRAEKKEPKNEWKKEEKITSLLSVSIFVLAEAAAAAAAAANYTRV